VSAGEPPILDSMAAVAAFRLAPGRRHTSADWAEVRAGATADVYFARGADVLRRLGRLEAPVVAEVFSQGEGILCGVEEALSLLEGRGVDVDALDEGERFAPKEPVMRIEGPYGAFGLFETALLGCLASASGWATAARRVREAAGEDAVLISFGARHVHPAVASTMERAAIVGGMDGAASVLGARLAGREPVGTVPHAVVLIAGDTVEVARALAADEVEGPVTVLVDTFHDEAEEALRVAAALGRDLGGVRLDTPSERGGVTPGLVQEVRHRLDRAGFGHVAIFVSGSLTPERIVALKAAGATRFGVGHYISAAPPIDMTMDVKVVEGRDVAKRGRIPGRTESARLRPRLRGGSLVVPAARADGGGG
jgi:nicotinate phosphoribosyltransferase